MTTEQRQPWRKDRRLVVTGVGCVLAGFAVARLIFGDPWHLPPDRGDIPTWLAVVVATVGGYIALSQLKQQQQVIERNFARQADRDQLLDIQIREAEARMRTLARAQAGLVTLSGRRELRAVPKPGSDGEYAAGGRAQDRRD